MKPIIIIPARGGSKRIPKKNIIDINGKPAIGILIEKLLDFKLANQVIVSTDDTEITSIAESYGAKVKSRSNLKLSNDYTPSEEVIRDFLAQDKTISENQPVFCIYPLAVLLKKSYLEEALGIFEKFSNEFVICASILNPNPLRHSFFLDEKSVKVLFPQFNEKRSQDLVDVYYDAGLFYLASKSVWLNEYKYWYKGNSKAVIVPTEDSIDVDTLSDLNKLKQRLTEI